MYGGGSVGESWDIFIEGIYMKLRILKNLNLNTER